MKKKKILIYGMTSAVGGIENYIITILQNIDQCIFDIDLLVKEDIIGINSKNIKDYYRKIYKIPSIYKHPIKVFLALKKISKDNKYDVIHFNLCLSTACIYGLVLKLFSNKTKIYIHSHNGSIKNKFKHYIFRPISNIIADKKLACSEVAAKWMFGAKYVKQNKVVLLNNFIDTNKFLFNENIRNKIRKELNIENKFVLGHVGRFDYQKNHKGLIDIFSKVEKENDNVVLILLGTGDLETKIKNYVHYLNLDKKVLFVGLKENANEYYQAMDLFLLPSLYEGLPIVGIEAQASGLKCFFSDTIDKKSDITGNVEFISLGGLNLWEKKISQVVKNGYIRKNMKKSLVIAGYDLEEEIKKIENMYLKG